MLRKMLLGALFALGLPLSTSAAAAPDSNADADGGFHDTVARSSAVMIKVPIDAQGRENTNASELRLISGGSKAQPANFEAAWSSGLDVSKQPVLPATAADSSTSHDSSTYGYWGWNNWYGYGWNYNYYYTYNPYYYYYSNYYYYSTPYYYNYYYGYGYPCYGYRYYYYPAGW